MILLFVSLQNSRPRNPIAATPNGTPIPAPIAGACWVACFGCCEGLDAIVEAGIVENKVIGVPETSANCVASLVKSCTVAGVATGDDEDEVMGGKPRMAALVKRGRGKLDWVLDTLASL